MRANHCCGSASKHCLGPWNTPERHQVALANANHNKHQPYLGKLPPFIIPRDTWPRIGKLAVVSQGEPTIVVAVPQNIAWGHGTHQKDTRWHLPMPITTNISHTKAKNCPPFSSPESLSQGLANWLLRVKESQPLLWQCLKTLPGAMEHTRKTPGGTCQCQSPQKSAIPRPTAPLLHPWRGVLAKDWQIGCCESRRANHCCGSASKHCLGPWNTPERHQVALANANHPKNLPYLGQLPPFFIPGEESWPRIGKLAVVSQGEPTIVVAVPQNIAWGHGTHQKDT